MTGIARSDDVIQALKSYNVTADQVLAVPLVAAGMSDDMVARRIGISKGIVRRWREEDPAFIDAVEYFRKNYAGWYSELVQRAVIDALSTLVDVMEMPDDGSPAVMRAKMNAAKTVLSIYENRVQNVNVNLVPHGRPDDNYTPESVEILSRRLAPLQDSESVEDAEIRMAPHPDTTYGHVVRDGNGRVICHICGARTRDVVSHSVTKHGIGEDEYRRMFGIPDGVDLG